MKSLGLSLFVFAFTRLASAALPSVRESAEYVTPAESVTVLRGAAVLCTSRGPFGARGLSFIQLGSGRCPDEIRKPVGWDRPEEEINSPGIPFKGRGL